MSQSTVQHQGIKPLYSCQRVGTVVMHSTRLFNSNFATQLTRREKREIQQENQPTSGIVRHNSHVQIFGSNPTENQTLNPVCQGGSKARWISTGMKGRGNERSPRKPDNQRHHPARFPHVKIQKRTLSPPTWEHQEIALQEPGAPENRDKPGGNNHRNWGNGRYQGHHRDQEQKDSDANLQQPPSAPPLNKLEGRTAAQSLPLQQNDGQKIVFKHTRLRPILDAKFNPLGKSSQTVLKRLDTWLQDTPAQCWETITDTCQLVLFTKILQETSHQHHLEVRLYCLTETQNQPPRPHMGFL
ncbi:hypothetical protein PR048_001333 [Dryococelus australis]|uniref:Uncharacterized protein n=1 Tax=Dryococelus australis TaxID=614101 RepID=A0ABQ9IH57_9NEOP|nr:hypothetical protein PR048_001333 [Dryococelus australis]